MVHIIITGNPVEGFEAYGPFPSEDVAAAFGNTNPHLPTEWWTMPVHDVYDDENAKTPNPSPCVDVRRYTAALAQWLDRWDLVPKAPAGTPESFAEHTAALQVWLETVTHRSDDDDS